MNKMKLTTALVAALMLTGTTSYASAQEHTTKVGQYAGDSAITTKVKAKIFEDKALKVAEVNVETDHGVVLLSGFVSNKASAELAEKVAHSVKGVKEVKNDLRVK